MVDVVIDVEIGMNVRVKQDGLSGWSIGRASKYCWYYTRACISYRDVIKIMMFVQPDQKKLANNIVVRNGGGKNAPRGREG